MKCMPLVSVIMPAFNASKYIDAAIESVLAQSFRDFEFLIVDDGSTDSTRLIIDKYAKKDGRIRYISRTNRGMVSTMQELVEMSRGALLARMDADDIAVNTRFQRQVEYLNDHPECVALGTQAYFVDSGGRIIGHTSYPIEHEDILNRLLMRTASPVAIIHPSVMMRRSAVKQVGGYRAKFEASEDRDLWLRLADVGCLANLAELLLYYRQHIDSFSQKRSDLQKRFSLLAVKEAYQRRGETLPKSMVSQIKARSKDELEMYADWAKKAMSQGYWISAVRYTWLRVRKSPFRKSTWRLVYNLIKSLMLRNLW